MTKGLDDKLALLDEIERLRAMAATEVIPLGPYWWREREDKLQGRITECCTEIASQAKELERLRRVEAAARRALDRGIHDKLCDVVRMHPAGHCQCYVSGLREALTPPAREGE